MPVGVTGAGPLRAWAPYIEAARFVALPAGLLWPLLDLSDQDRVRELHGVSHALLLDLSGLVDLEDDRVMVSGMWSGQ